MWNGKHYGLIMEHRRKREKTEKLQALGESPPFLYVNGLFLDPEVQTLQSYTMAIGQFQQDIRLWGINQDPKDSKESPLYAPGTQVLIKV